MSDSDSKVVEPGPEQILADWLDVELRKLQLPQQSVEEIHAAVEALRVEALSAINELRQELGQSHDSLTGVGSRRSIEARLAMEWERSRRYGRPLSLVAIEVNRSGPASNSHSRPRAHRPIIQFLIFLRELCGPSVISVVSSSLRFSLLSRLIPATAHTKHTPP